MSTGDSGRQPAEGTHEGTSGAVETARGPGRGSYENRPLCGATTRKGGKCRRVAGTATDHLGWGSCAWHSGSTPNGRKAGAAAMARAHVAALGGPTDLDPHDALQQAVDLTAAEVNFYSARIAELGDQELAGQAVVAMERVDGDGDTTTERRTLAPALNVWVAARAQALERLAKFAKMALDAGVAERRVRVVEGQASQLAAVLNAVMGDLVAAGLAPDMRALASDSFRRHVALLDAVPGTADEVTA